MRDSVRYNRVKSGIEQQNLRIASCGRVTVADRAHLAFKIAQCLVGLAFQFLYPKLKGFDIA
jgi:hypothetical protein